MASGRRLSHRQRGGHGHLQREGCEDVTARADPRGVLGYRPREHRGRVLADEDVGAFPGVGGGGGGARVVRSAVLDAALARTRGGRRVQIELEYPEAARARRCILRR